MFFRCDFFFFSSRRRHTRCSRDWSSDVCSSDLTLSFLGLGFPPDIPTWGRILFDAKDNLDFADRKSTRLNSSHGYISYAVFCLKKKKKSNIHDSLSHAIIIASTPPQQISYKSHS